MSALNRKLIRDLAHMRGQVAAVTLVVTCGIATYVTMRAAYQALVETRTEYYAAYRFPEVFAHLKRAPEAVGAAIAAIPGVAAVQTRVVMDVTLDIPGLAEPATARLVSIPERRVPMLNDLFIKQGRYIEAGSRDEVLMSEVFGSANRLRTGDYVDAVLNGRWERLRIAGLALSPEYIYEIRPSEVFPDNRRFGVLWMSRDAMGHAFNMDGAFNDVSLALARGASQREVIARLDRLLDRYGGLGAYGREDQISYRFLTDELGELRTVGLVLPTLFLAIVSFLLHILISRLIATQRSQVAVLKAFGYRKGEIAAHYLKLALLAVSTGTAAGIGLGLWFASRMMETYALYFHFPELRLRVDPQVAIIATGISIGAAGLGALAAVRRAAAVMPAEGMRAEPPAHFRTGILERVGLTGLFSPASRMILRNLERRPWKAFLSALAMAFAVAILVVGRFLIDAVNNMVSVQFGHLQREDVTVVFQEARPAHARFALAQLPGVLRVEAYREVPVRLRLGHRSRRAGLLGISNDSELRPLLDHALRHVELPPEGIVLNNKLAEILAAKPGDTLAIEVLEGVRPKRQAHVAALIDQPIGLGAYMDAAALHRLMREGGAVSGAYMRVDPITSGRLYSLLKRTPSISGVVAGEFLGHLRQDDQQFHGDTGRVRLRNCLRYRLQRSADRAIGAGQRAGQPSRAGLHARRNRRYSAR